MSTQIPDVCIVGAGVMGLLSALELADAGLHVHLLDRGQAAQESSWAGGGIISPLYPWRYPASITALATFSQLVYPEIIARIRDVSGIDPQFTRHGMLVTAMTERADALAWGALQGGAVQTLSVAEASQLEPHATLHEEPLWMPQIASVRTPRLGQALYKTAALHPRITVREHQSVSLSGSVEQPVVMVNGESQRADRVVVAAGAWTQSLLDPLGVSTPIRPMKGQMLLFAPSFRVGRVVLADGRYAIPRADGRIVFGSTLEDVGFQRCPDEPAHRSLYASALHLIPSLADVPVELQWSGFRPAAPGGIPWIGALSQRLWVNAGHYRNGVVLAPASARLLVDSILSRPPVVDPTPYQPRIDA